MKAFPKFLLICVAILVTAGALFIGLRTRNKVRIDNKIAYYAGSKSCKPCHERFYELWAPSHHGTAMQQVNAKFIKDNIKSFASGIQVGESLFNVEQINDSLVFTQELKDGSIEEFTAVHTMGGKYIYYFLTEFERGRLHTLPLAYDCKTDTWYNNPESGVRHFETMGDQALDWKNHLYTFNVSCYNCHVSQLKSNFSLENLSYETSWGEAGINCETCHGPSSEHVRVCVEAGEGQVPEDLKIIVTSKYTKEQHNSSCGSCHAKSSIVKPGYPPGERFYDYFDLTTLENHDFYADGRDLGENYTMTTWAQNICMQEANLHCASCHTSSGRYRFAGDNANQACAPCHNDKIADVGTHSGHKIDGEGSLCVSCHMPMTTFARMDRSDHSFRPPMPEATMAFGSPNACNICHSDKSPEWANREIKKIHTREYQSETIALGKLIRLAREADWSELSEITAGLESGVFNEVYATSFIRLLENCSDSLKWNSIIKRTYDDSPLVRSAAAHALVSNGEKIAFDRLSELVDDDYRLVRMNAAFAISAYGGAYPSIYQDSSITRALNEYVNSLLTRKDDWASHYNLGNFYSNNRDYENAIIAYTNSIRVYPEAIISMINAGYLYSLSGDYNSALAMFEKALSIEPDHEAALLNLALLSGETGKKEEAISIFRKLMKVSDKNAIAAFNLSILLSDSDINEALSLGEKACLWDPNPRYRYTNAYFLNKSGSAKDAASKLISIISDYPEYMDSYSLIVSVMKDLGRGEEASAILNKALVNEKLSKEQKQYIISLLKTNV